MSYDVTIFFSDGRWSKFDVQGLNVRRAMARAINFLDMELDGNDQRLLESVTIRLKSQELAE